jgi:hypothetical protein
MEDSNMMDLMEATARLEAATEALEQAAARLAEKQVVLEAEAQEYLGRIVATVDYSQEQKAMAAAEASTVREAELERRLAEAEAKISELSAGAAGKATGRKTLLVGMATMLAKQGVTVESMDAGAIDGALSSLSIEQRIAVKAELMRAGLLGQS